MSHRRSTRRRGPTRAVATGPTRCGHARPLEEDDTVSIRTSILMCAAPVRGLGVGTTKRSGRQRAHASPGQTNSVQRHLISFLVSGNAECSKGPAPGCNGDLTADTGCTGPGATMPEDYAIWTTPLRCAPTLTRWQTLPHRRVPRPTGLGARAHGSRSQTDVALLRVREPQLALPPPWTLVR